MKNKKNNKRNLKRSFRFEKICSGFVYCIYEYVFEKLVDIEIYLISVFCVLYTNVIFFSCMVQTDVYVMLM